MATAVGQMFVKLPDDVECPECGEVIGEEGAEILMSIGYHPEKEGDWVFCPGCHKPTMMLVDDPDYETSKPA